MPKTERKKLFVGRKKLFFYFFILTALIWHEPYEESRIILCLKDLKLDQLQKR